jgi:hypothetical protein
VNGQAVLDVVFGVVFVFFVFSLLCSGMNESVARILNKRARFLEEGIWQLLKGDSQLQGEADRLFRRFWEHPLIRPLGRPVKDGGRHRAFRSLRWLARRFQSSHIKALSAPGANIPSDPLAPGTRRATPAYIPSQTFALVALDLLKPETRPAESPLHEFVRLASDAPGAGGAVQGLGRTREEVERWFDAHMERVSGWYKQEAKSVLVAFAVIVVVVFNLDSVAIARTLWTEPTVRDLVTRTAQYSLDTAGATSTTSTTAARGAAAGTPPIAAPTTAAGAQRTTPTSATTTTTTSGSSTMTTTAVHVPPLVCVSPTTASTAVANPTSSTSTSTTEEPTRTDLKAAADCARLLAYEGLPIGWPKPVACQHPVRHPGAPRATRCHTLPDRFIDIAVSRWRSGFGSLLLLLFGWGISTGALAMGAPFWWDQLNRLGSLRSTGPKPKPSS